jgi:hypothetical protein
MRQREGTKFQQERAEKQKEWGLYLPDPPGFSVTVRQQQKGESFALLLTVGGLCESRTRERQNAAFIKNPLVPPVPDICYISRRERVTAWRIGDLISRECGIQID